MAKSSKPAAPRGPAATALKAMRERSGLSVRATAEALGVSPSSYSSYERGYKKELLPIDLAMVLSRIFSGRGDPPISRGEVMELALPKLVAPELIATVERVKGRVAAARSAADKGLPQFHSESDVQPITAPIRPAEPRRLPLAQHVPVWGVVEGGSDGQFEVNLSSEPLEYIDVPAALVGVPDVGALWVAAMSMAGIWAPGDPVFFAKRRPVTPECYVIALVEAGPGEMPRAFLKQFVKRDNQTTVLRQFNPDMTLTFPNEQIREMWRALHWRELMNLR